MADNDKVTNAQKSDWEMSGHAERRQDHRRAGEDRREMIRFELDKNDRRRGKERRKDKRSGWDGGTTI